MIERFLSPMWHMSYIVSSLALPSYILKAVSAKMQLSSATSPLQVGPPSEGGWGLNLSSEREIQTSLQPTPPHQPQVSSKGNGNGAIQVRCA